MQLKEKIKASGFKQSHIAKQINVSETYFSQVVTGKKFLSMEKEQKLMTILKISA